jgi:hypothetical protein
MAALCTAALLLALTICQQGEAQGTGLSKSAEVYFPKEITDSFAGFFSGYLSSIGEPSLLAAAKDRSVLSYRLDWLAGQTGVLLVIRLSANPDTGAEVTWVRRYGTPPTLRRDQRPVSGALVDKFTDLVEEADFWSMPPMKEGNPDLAGGSYKLDASTWLFEGVRSGTYHVVLRRSPEAGRFTDMIRFLAKNIADLDESIVPAPVPRQKSIRP